MVVEYMVVEYGRQHGKKSLDSEFMKRVWNLNRSEPALFSALLNPQHYHCYAATHSPPEG